jgi:uncharacterized integral membrane protein
MPQAKETRPATTGERAPAKRERARQVAALAIGALVAVFAVVNLDRVDVNWILGTWSTPLILVIAVTFVLGAALGAFLATRRGRRRRA